MYAQLVRFGDFLLVSCMLCNRLLQKCMCKLCCQACKENNHHIINMSDACERIQDIGSKRRAHVENLKSIVKKSTGRTLGTTELEESHAVRIWHSYGKIII
jgi:hypothetical protein